MDEAGALRALMEEAGCEESSIKRAEALCAAGAREELVRCLRRCRSRQMETLHEKQRQLDRLDLLIRRAQS